MQLFDDVYRIWSIVYEYTRNPHALVKAARCFWPFVVVDCWIGNSVISAEGRWWRRGWSLGGRPLARPARKLRSTASQVQIVASSTIRTSWEFVRMLWKRRHYEAEMPCCAMLQICAFGGLSRDSLSFLHSTLAYVRRTHHRESAWNVCYSVFPLLFLFQSLPGYLFRYCFLIFAFRVSAHVRDCFQALSKHCKTRGVSILCLSKWQEASNFV